jgi:hypothetical protein
MISRENRAKLAELGGSKVLKNVDILKTLTNKAEVVNSPEYKAVFDGYVDTHQKLIMIEMQNYKAHFTPEGIYEEYTMDGIRFLNKLEKSSTISDTPLHQALVVDNEFILKLERNWKKCKENRAFFRKAADFVVVMD